MHRRKLRCDTRLRASDRTRTLKASAGRKRRRPLKGFVQPVALDQALAQAAAVHLVFDFAAALCNLQRRFVATMMFCSPSGLIWRFFRAGFALAGGADPDSPRDFAHLAFCAKAIRRLAPALIFLRLRDVASGVAAVPLELPVSIARSSAIWASMRSF